MRIFCFPPTIRAWGASALLAVLVAPAASGGDDLRQPAGGEARARLPAFEDVVSVGWVEIPVLVRDKRGAILGLEQRHFSVRVDDRPVAVEAFEQTGGPVGILVAQDLSGSMAIGDKLRTSRRWLNGVAARMRQGDEAAVIGFGGKRVDLLLDFADDPATLIALAGEFAPSGTTALRDALALLPSIAADSRAQHRAILLLTDGIDNASDLTPEQVRELLREASVPLYVVDLASGVGQRRSLEVAADLRLMAAASGGRYVAASDDAAERHRVGFLDEIRERYVLGFSTEPSEQTGRHTVEVRVRADTRELLYRTHYYGGSPTDTVAADQKPSRLPTVSGKRLVNAASSLPN